MTVNALEAEKIINQNSDVVDFGTSSDIIDIEWIEKGQNRLGLTFSNSYLWFLKNYAGGEIAGEEIFSIYGMEFDDVFGGDIVFQHITNLKNGLTDENKLVISENDFGEVFFFNYLEVENNEPPIYMRLPSGDEILYAENFYEFIIKRIKENL